MLVLSHFCILFPVKLPAFLRENAVDERLKPPAEDAVYVVSLSVALILIVFPVRVTVAALLAVKLIIPVTALPSASEFAFTNVTVLVSVEAIVIVEPD